MAKSKSMVTEETELNHALEAAGIEVVETDLGEFIVQLGNDRPSHLIAPVLHTTRYDVAGSSPTGWESLTPTSPRS